MTPYESLPMTKEIEKNSPWNDESHHIQAIEAMISKYSSGLDENIQLSDPKLTRNVLTETVFLTGSTGNVGSQLLATLLSMDRVRRVYSFNRPSSSSVSIIDRHRERFEDKALDVALLSSEKVVFLEVDNDLPGLGLSEAMIIELQKELTLIIHVGWMLHLTKPLSTFESQVKGTRNLIDLARSAEKPPRFLFASSVMTGQNWDQTKGPYPEELVMDAKYAVGFGYGESKYVVERMLAKSGLDAISMRIGQVCGGDPNGAWAISEWLPMSVNISLSLGVIYAPQNATLFQWIPMDALSDTILDIGFSDEARLPLTVNIQHPYPATAVSIMRAIRSSMIRELKLPSDSLLEVSVEVWINHFKKKVLENSVKASSSSRILRAFERIIRTVDAEDQLYSLSNVYLSNGMKLSRRMRELKPIDDALVNKWIRYWVASRLLHSQEQLG